MLHLKLKKTKLKLNKKSNLLDIFDSSRYAFLFFFLVVISIIVFGTINDKFQSNNNVSDDSKSFMSNYNTKIKYAFDYGFLFLLIGFLLFSVISARLIQSSRLFYIISLIMILFVWLVSIIVGALYEQFINSSTIFETTVNSLTYIPYIMPNMLYYALIYTALVAITLYTKDD